MSESPREPATLGCPGALPPAEGAALTPTHIGDFTIVRVLGEGGMGTVYLAEDVRLGRKAAIKTLKPELAASPANRERFLREARAAAAVEHDNIVPIWQIGDTADGAPFIAMPFLQGEVLESRLQREPTVPLGLILKVALEVAKGLAAAHEHGLIHRDVKPSNVWLEGDPKASGLEQQVRRCKILDFGLVRSVNSSDALITTTGMVVGTPAYMSPEQARGELAGPRSDLFSLGAMLYRISTGRPPFAGPSVMAVLTALATVDPPPAHTLRPSLPRDLSDLIARLMSKSPDGRPESAAEVVVAVRQIVKDLQSRKSAAPVEAPAPPEQPPEPVDEPDTELVEAESSTDDDSAPAEKPRSGRGRVVLLAAVGLLALVPLVWGLTTFLPRARKAPGPDGKHEPQKELPKGPSPDRKGAEWVLSVGGMVCVDGQAQQLKTNDELPTAPFKLTWVGLHNNKRVTDPGLAHLAECKELTQLLLDGTPVSDAGLVWFKDHTNLVVLSLPSTSVSDAGLSYFKGCKNLTVLGLGSTWVSNTGLAHFAGCKNLTHLMLDGTRVTDEGLALFKGRNLTLLGVSSTPVSDAGLANFAGCTNLTHLWLDATDVSNRGLAYFKDCKNLTAISLARTKVGDEGLAHFQGCKGLTVLNLEGTQVTDSGVAWLPGCKHLTNLYLQNTKVSNAKIAELRQALPRCKVEGDNSTAPPPLVINVDPKLVEFGLSFLRPPGTGGTPADRKAAVWALSLGGKVKINDQPQEIKDAAALPGEVFRLSSVDLAGNAKVTDSGLAHFSDCKNLTHLTLQTTPVTDAGLARFAGCTSLLHLALDGTPVSDAGVADFKGCKNLSGLGLSGTRVTGSCLAHFADCKNLLYINLRNTKVPRATVEAIRKALPRCNVDWDGK
jgi:serine/threonine protein kinase